MTTDRKPLWWAAFGGLAVLIIGIASGNITLFLTLLVVWNIVFVRMMVVDMLDE